jgi:G:T-mismatch repair DNA endonuclease (very short patch repair protein)|tara:strand:- start:252 stop:470 length:219 start_codon:yes stop_codon:yes gene_type:complete
MTESWLEKLERDITRKNKVRKELRKEINDRIEQLKLLDKDIDDTLNKALATDQPSRTDVEWDLLNERLNGGK